MAVPSTFRDPAGSLWVRGESVLRSIRPSYADQTVTFLNSSLSSALVSEANLVPSTIVRHDQEGVLLSHPRVPFISYPWEWPASLWLAAAECTLDLCSRLVEHDWVLKDATPLNVLFEGVRPIFVDVLSIEPLDLSKAIWLPYAQFIRTFTLPMLAHSQLGWPLQAAQLRRDGFEPEEVYRALSWFQRCKGPVRSIVTLPVLLHRVVGKMSTANRLEATGSALARQMTDPEINRKMLLNRLRGLRSAMQQAAPPSRSSTWSEYAETAGHYAAQDHLSKQVFVKETLAACEAKAVLDVGCNSGVYSMLAAEYGSEVIAIDPDMQSLERLYARAKSEGRNILPLCVDLAYPTPSFGWENRESLSFLERCDNRFDLVLMLAVIHHLLFTSQIPIDRIAALCNHITRGNLIVEWVPPSDPKCVEVLRGREALYEHVNEEGFRSAFGAFFSVARELRLQNGRLLFHLVKR